MKELSWDTVKMRKTLSIDCAACQGLCCRELYFSKSDGFPADKPAGKPCSYLMPDFRCGIHSELEKRGMKGCIAYDCFGAGQAAVQNQGDFHRMFRLRQMRWYLLEAADHSSDEAMLKQIHELIGKQKLQDPQTLQGRNATENQEAVQGRNATENQEAVQGRNAELNQSVGSDEKDQIEDIEEYQDQVNEILKQVIGRNCKKGRPRRQNMGGMDFREKDLCFMDFTFTFLIAANLSGCKFYRTSLLGADLRDARLEGADLSGSLFLTQGQINSAGGDGKTKLPSHLTRPESWKR